MKALARISALVLLLAFARDAGAFERQWGLELGLTPGITGLGFDGGSYAPSAGLSLGLGHMVHDALEVRAAASAAPMRARGSGAEGDGWLTSTELGIRVLDRKGDSPWATQFKLMLGVGTMALSRPGEPATTFVGFTYSTELGAERELSRDLSLGLALRLSMTTLPSRSGLETVDALGILVGPVFYVRRSWGF